MGNVHTLQMPDKCRHVFQLALLSRFLSEKYSLRPGFCCFPTGFKIPCTYFFRMFSRASVSLRSAGSKRVSHCCTYSAVCLPGRKISSHRLSMRKPHSSSLGFDVLGAKLSDSVLRFVLKHQFRTSIHSPEGQMCAIVPVCICTNFERAFSEYFQRYLPQSTMERTSQLPF